MSRYHINPDTGNVGVCSAKIQCYFIVDGVEPPHYDNIEVAQKAAEEQLAEQYKNVLAKSREELVMLKRKEETAAQKGIISPIRIVGEEYLTQIAPYQSTITPTSRVFVHPQGKVAVLNENLQLQVFKNGKKVTSSVPASEFAREQMVGSWKQVDKDIVKKIAVTSNEDNDELQRQKALGDYPLTSHFDTRKDNLKFVKKNTRDGYKTAILPTATRVNPHQSLGDNEYLKSWGNDTSIEVWKDDNGKTVLVAGSADPYEVGSTGLFQHDQSSARIGTDWTLVGAFENVDGGQAVGEIPNRKVPLYTYK